jgi:alginate O-acetyltransferase complex protein AlgI
MLFNSFVFVWFFLLVYLLYLASKRSVLLQNSILLVASYVFYGYWNYKFLSLIALSTLIDYFVGQKLYAETAEKKRRIWLSVSVIANLAILGFFKYFNFFADSFADFIQLFGFQADYVTLKIVLPVGISFYTFQTMSYTIDIYRRKLTPTKNFINFALFVSFFPQLVAGPIERASRLLPQIEKKRTINSSLVNEGIFLIIWGYFKKIVIADNCAIITENLLYDNGINLLIALFAFTLQIYGDFSGYSDIARGISKLMGFDLMLNFRLPYFALSPSDFWQRWHISLSSWLRDYLYIPLGGNKLGISKTYRNLMLTMLIGGLWHGASWNFVFWGAFHGLILVIYRYFKITPEREQLGFLKRSMYMLPMFLLTMFGWLLFRIQDVSYIPEFLSNIFNLDSSIHFQSIRKLAIVGLPLLVLQVAQHKSKNLNIILHTPLIIQYMFYLTLIVLMILFGVHESSEFIYFQF